MEQTTLALMEELKRKITAIEWDIQHGLFNKEKLPYYHRLKNEFERLQMQFVNPKS